jgi:hypothetical protein
VLYVVIFLCSENKWTGVVTRNEKPEYPAYNPQFPPAVPLMSSSSSNRGSPNLQQQYHQPNMSSSSTGSVHSRDSVLYDQDVDCVEGSTRAFDGGLRHCRTEADLSRGVSREVSSDSGGVFLTPSPGPHAGTPQFDANRKPLTMAEISRRLLSYDESSATAVGGGQTTDGELGGNPNASVDHRRLSSPSNVGDVVDIERTSHFRSNSVRAAGSGDRRASGPSPASRVFPRDVADESRSDRPVFSSGPVSQKKGKKGSKVERDSRPTDHKSGVTSAKSYKVHGGNPKWSWR